MILKIDYFPNNEGEPRVICLQTKEMIESIHFSKNKPPDELCITRIEDMLHRAYLAGKEGETLEIVVRTMYYNK